MMSLRLTELAELLANEDITQQEHDEARRSALGIVKTSLVQNCNRAMTIPGNVSVLWEVLYFK